MTIDERLENLTARQEYVNERHLALAQSVELLVLEGRKTDERLSQMARSVEMFSQNMQDFLNILRNHENRIGRLEDPALGSV